MRLPRVVPKGRRPKFELTLKIIDLNNVPFTSGASYVKWHLPGSTSAEHRGKTDKAIIKEHKVVWEYEKTLVVRLTIDKTNMLQECLINFEVVQDYNYGGRGEKITLGHVGLNLAEYVESYDEGDDEGVTRRYLMQESKINSTLKIGISMAQVDGERNFIAPPLKTAPVFGGIAGIMGGEKGDSEEIGSLPMLNKTREAGELQDMYRRTISAYWASQAGELPADQCIEDIFAGGTGWASKTKQDKVPQPRQHDLPGDQTAHFGEYERWINKRSHHHHHRKNSGSSPASRTTTGPRNTGPGTGHRHTKSKEQADLKNGTNDITGGVDMNLHSSSLDVTEKGRSGDHFKNVHEISEFDIKEDLRSWRVPGPDP
ncbi:MAG: hypothetical protein M1818_006813 [Claussenomyces sp. TS43310]|nr:MAG: hypothetical protein M1818_006813 [Claussenomyces sp. TS43310]